MLLRASRGLPQLGVLGFGLLVDGDVGIGVFPEGEEILIRLARGRLVAPDYPANFMLIVNWRVSGLTGFALIIWMSVSRTPSMKGRMYCRGCSASEGARTVTLVPN